MSGNYPTTFLLEDGSGYDLTEADLSAEASYNSTSYNMTAPPSEQEEYTGKHLAKTLWIFVAPFIFFVGVTGNVLVIAIMGRKRMRGTTTSVYLRLMAMADIGAIISGIIPEWLEASDIVIFKGIHPATCKIEKFTYYTCADTSIWILVIFTVDRFIAVCYPLKTKNICVASRAPYFAFSAFTLAVIKNFHVFWTRGAVYDVTTVNVTSFDASGVNVTSLQNITEVYNCGRIHEDFEFYVRPWIAFTLVSALPFIVIVFCNILIVRALVKVRKMRKNKATVSKSDRILVQMTLMCLAACFCFLVCITPSILLSISKPYLAYQNLAYTIAKAVNNQLVYVNHSANFFLYCVTGKRFRQELVYLCRRRKDTDSPAESTATHTDQRTTFYRVVPSRRSPHVRNGAVRYWQVNNKTVRFESTC